MAADDNPTAAPTVLVATFFEAPAAPAPGLDADDFFVLPGESLAKYRGGPSENGEEFAEDTSDTHALGSRSRQAF